MTKLVFFSMWVILRHISFSNHTNDHFTHTDLSPEAIDEENRGIRKGTVSISWKISYRKSFSSEQLIKKQRERKNSAFVRS